jgi:hypothetical protein
MSESVQKKSGAGKGVGIAVITMILLGLLPFWFLMIAPAMRHDRLTEKGVRAKGRLLSVEETGTVINDVPEIELVVEFTRADGVLDTTTTDFVPTMRSLHLFQTGTQVTAAYDPEDPDELTIIELTTSPMQFTASPSTSAADSIARVADSLRQELERLQRR